MADSNVASEMMPRVKLGSQGLESCSFTGSNTYYILVFRKDVVSRLGYGCMGLTGIYNNPLPTEEGIQVLKEVYNRGITFFDTADVYGGPDHGNEILVGKVLKELPREKIQLATKFGIFKMEPTKITVNGTPEYARSSCEGSIKRLGVDYIDLYYIHRVDTTVPIEDTMEELKKMVEEGKIKYIGLSEANADTIRRAHAVHPITALQMEYSLWTRDIEAELIPLCRELGIGIVPYSPVARGFFGGKAVKESLPENSILGSHPRFTGENFTKNKVIYDKVETTAKKQGCTPIQLALAWVLHQGNDVVPIPGTTKIKNLDENVGAVKVKLTKEDVEEICKAVPIDEVAGCKTSEALLRISWKFANSPPKISS